MKAIFSLILLSCAYTFIHAQSYYVGVQMVTYIDSSRSNRSIPVEVHYPATATGNGTPIATDSFPFVVFGHGFVMTASCYYPFSDTLASRGYLFAFPTTESSLSPDHADFAQDLIFVYNKLISANTDSTSPFYQHVMARGAIAGHSMGGGCTVLSAQYSNPAACYWTLAEATTTPSSITAASSMTKPYLSLAGSYDCIAPYTTNQLPTYDSSASPCKFLIEVTGASHCQWGVSNTACNLGQSVSGCDQPPLSQSAQINTGLSYIGPYLDYYLRGNANALETFDSVYVADTIDVKTNNCLAFPLNGIRNISSLHAKLYPDPASNMLYIEADKNISMVQLIDYSGQYIMQKAINAASSKIDLSVLPAGIYMIEMSTNDGQTSLMKFSKE